MTGRSVNTYLQEETYNRLRKLTGNRKISRFVDEAIVEKLTKEREKNKEELKKKMIEGYKANAKNKKNSSRIRSMRKNFRLTYFNSNRKKWKKKRKKSLN